MFNIVSLQVEARDRRNFSPSKTSEDVKVSMERQRSLLEKEPGNGLHDKSDAKSGEPSNHLQPVTKPPHSNPSSSTTHSPSEDGYYCRGGRKKQHRDRRNHHRRWRYESGHGRRRREWLNEDRGSRRSYRYRDRGRFREDGDDRRSYEDRNRERMYKN